VILGPVYVFKNMAYFFVVEELNNDGDYTRRLLCSVTVVFLGRKQNLAGHKFVQERELETVTKRSLIKQETVF
jgi:hypothetical protein